MGFVPIRFVWTRQVLEIKDGVYYIWQLKEQKHCLFGVICAFSVLLDVLAEKADGYKLQLQKYIPCNFASFSVPIRSSKIEDV